jgi:hypothetical protein
VFLFGAMVRRERDREVTEGTAIHSRSTTARRSLRAASGIPGQASLSLHGDPTLVEHTRESGG